jgi:protein involved in polysaccharide export with SLBB domain
MSDNDEPASVVPQIRRLKVHDKIRIEFVLNPALNQVVTIPPDEMITLQGVGRIRTAGLMPDQLAEVIGKRYLELNVYSKVALIHLT